MLKPESEIKLMDATWNSTSDALIRARDEAKQIADKAIEKARLASVTENEERLIRRRNFAYLVSMDHEERKLKAFDPESWQQYKIAAQEIINRYIPQPK